MAKKTTADTAELDNTGTDVQETAEQKAERLERENAKLKSTTEALNAKLSAHEATSTTVFTDPIDGVVYEVRMSVRTKETDANPKGVVTKEVLAKDEALCREILAKEGQQVLVQRTK